MTGRRGRATRRRAAGVLGGGLLLGLVLSGCGGDASRDVVVSFRADPATEAPYPADVAAARKACPGTPSMRPQPAPTSTLLSVRQHPLRYGAATASDHDIAVLVACLQKVPGVTQAVLEDQDY
jgi:hypothetical protein